jgi:hypothetical protein
MSIVKNYRFQNMFIIFILIFFSVIFILVGTPTQNFKKEILKLDKMDIYWYVYKKELDKEVHNYETIWFYKVGSNIDSISNIYRMWHSTYELLYNSIDVGDTIIKPKGSTTFYIKNRAKSIVVSLDRKGN